MKNSYLYRSIFKDNRNAKITTITQQREQQNDKKKEKKKTYRDHIKKWHLSMCLMFPSAAMYFFVVFFCFFFGSEKELIFSKHYCLPVAARAASWRWCWLVCCWCCCCCCCCYCWILTQSTIDLITWHNITMLWYVREKQLNVLTFSPRILFFWPNTQTDWLTVCMYIYMMLMLL